MCCSVLQCIAMCCSVLQVLQCAAMCCSVLHCVVLCGSVLQCAVAVCCSVLQCVALCCAALYGRTFSSLSGHGQSTIHCKSRFVSELRLLSFRSKLDLKVSICSASRSINMQVLFFCVDPETKPTKTLFLRLNPPRLPGRWQSAAGCCSLLQSVAVCCSVQPISQQPDALPR